MRLPDIVSWLTSLDSPELYVAVALLAFAETAVFADLLVPGEVGLLLVAAAGSEAGLSWPVLAVCAGLGATAGDSVSFAVGRVWGRRILDWRMRKGGRAAAGVVRATDSFARRGGPAIFLGRWVGMLRAVVPVIAGSAGMPWRRFFGWNVLAAAGWSTAVVAVGYHVGPAATRFLRAMGWAAVAVLVVWLAAWWYSRRWRPQRARCAGRTAPINRDIRPAASARRPFQATSREESERGTRR